MLLVTGIILLVLLIVFILKSQFMPGNILLLLPMIAALLIGTGVSDTLKFTHLGITSVLPIAALFVFAIIYFGIMSDAGLFDPIIGFLTKKVKNSVFSVLVITACITIVSHLDGQGVTTLLVTVPAMLPIFDQMNIKRTMLALVFLTMVPIANLIPWGGPIARAGSVIGMDPTALTIKMIPVIIIGLVLCFVIYYIASKQYEKKGAFISNVELKAGEVQIRDEVKALKRPKLLVANAIITVIVLAALFAGLPSYILFMIGCAIVLPLNYRTLKEQNERVKAHAGNILIPVYTIIGAGALLGIMGNTGMFEVLANSVVNIVPESLSSIIHIIIGLFITPLNYILSADATIFGIMPVILDVGAHFGVSDITIAAMFTIGHNVGVALSMTNPAVYLALGLMGLEYREAFKDNFKWSIALGTVLVLITAIIVR